MYIYDSDLKDTEKLRKRKRNLENEKDILECKLDGVRKGIKTIESALKRKAIRDELEKKGIQEQGGQVELRYSNGTRYATTMGITDGYYPYLKIHKRLKSGKGWFKDTGNIGADKIQVIYPTDKKFPISPKLKDQGEK